MSSKFGSGGFEEIKTYKKFLAYIIMFQNVNQKKCMYRNYKSS